MKIRSVQANFALNLANTSLSFLFPLITFPYVTRVLGAAGYGTSEFALQTVSFFTLFALLGVNLYGTRECAKVREDKKALSKVTEELFIIISASTIIVTIVYALCISVIPSFSQHFDVFVVAGLFIPLNTLAVNWFISANEQYLFVTIRSLAVKISMVILMFLLVHAHDDVILWIGIYVFAEGAANVCNFILMKKNTQFIPLSQLEFKRHAKPMTLFFLTAAATTIYTCLDSVMLGAMTTTEEVAYYQIPVKIKNMMVSIMAALAAVIIARSSYYLSNNMIDEFNKLINASVRLAIVYAPICAVLVCLFAPPIIELFAGPGYEGAFLPLQLMMPAVIFVSFSYITSQELMAPLGFEKQLTITYSLAALVDFVLNLILIPAYGAVGATLATTIAELLVLITQSAVLFKHVDRKAIFRRCFRLILPVGLSIAFSIALWFFAEPTFLSAVIVSCASLLFLFIALLICGEELALSVPRFIKGKLGK